MPRERPVALPVPVDPGPLESVPVVEGGVVLDPSVGVGDFWTNLPARTVLERLKVVSYLSSESSSLEEANGKTLLVTGVAVYPVEMVDPEDGQVRQLIRTILVCEDGVVYHTYAVTARAALGRIVRALGRGLWTTGLPITVRYFKNANKHSQYSLSVDVKSLESRTGGK